jgi:hypothetical protein
LALASSIAETDARRTYFCANLGWKSRLSQWPATRSAVKVGIWLRSLGLDGLTAPAARFDPVDLRDSVVWEPTGASAAGQGVVVGDAAAKPAAPEAATAR